MRYIKLEFSNYVDCLIIKNITVLTHRLQVIHWTQSSFGYVLLKCSMHTMQTFSTSSEESVSCSILFIFCFLFPAVFLDSLGCCWFMWVDLSCFFPRPFFGRLTYRFTLSDFFLSSSSRTILTGASVSTYFCFLFLPITGVFLGQAFVKGRTAIGLIFSTAGCVWRVGLVAS